MTVHWAISLFTRDSERLSAFVEGRPRTIIVDGNVDNAALRAAHMSQEDLEEDLRQSGIDDAGLVKLAVLERSGRLSVIKQ
jgi:uncharacterized membrane protein YcaP (DUF421 family)